MNGRYFFVARVTLDDGSVLASVTFDAATNIAVAAGDQDVRYRYDLIGRHIVDLPRL